MNTANLQLEGVYAVLAAFMGAIRDTGLMTGKEIDQLLAGVENSLSEDPYRPSELRDSNVEAICFPARFLRVALEASNQGEPFSFAQITTRVGQMKAGQEQ